MAVFSYCIGQYIDVATGFVREPGPGETPGIPLIGSSDEANFRLDYNLESIFCII